jgi:hypothetical protein
MPAFTEPQTGGWDDLDFDAELIDKLDQIGKAICRTRGMRFAIA